MLQERLAAEETLADFGREAAIYLHGFVRRNRFSNNKKWFFCHSIGGDHRSA